MKYIKSFESLDPSEYYQPITSRAFNMLVDKIVNFVNKNTDTLLPYIYTFYLTINLLSS